MKEIVNSLYATLLKPGAKAPPVIRQPPLISPDDCVIDEPTFQSIEMDRLFDSLNHASTQAGQATLYRSLRQPLRSLAVLQAKQEALREIEATPILRQHMETCVKRASSGEKDFHELLFGNFLGLFGSRAHELEVEGFGYESYIRGTRFMRDLVEGIEHMPATANPYLNALFSNILQLRSSRAYALAIGPAYRAERGMLTREEKGWFTPAIRFRPTLFKPVGLTVMLATLLLALEFVPLLLDIVSSIAPVFWLFLLPISLVYIPIVGNFDRDSCIIPLRDIFRESAEVRQAVDALGQLDELLAFIRFRESFGHPMTLPELTEEKQHRLHLEDVRNPILAAENPVYVGNDIDLASTRLTLLTGPNSGGKTAFCKTLAQSQLLAQIGAYVPARQAKFSLADRIFYQAPEISHLTDGEGRFGTELRRTKAIFMAASPQSLVIMDELSEGTTHEEKIDISMTILDGFSQKGNSTVLITHNHELVDRYQEQGIGLACQVEFRNDLPTYKVIPGISRQSHADRVARKIGFSREDINRYLAEGGQN